MNLPLVSIIVPGYNQAQYLEEALYSVFNQTYENWECIIVNDGSLDNTADIAKKWVNKDNRFKYLYKENGGLSSARNSALNMITGEYIQFLDADDCLNKEKLSKSLFQIKDHSNYNIIISHFKMFKENIHDELNSFCELSQDVLLYDKILYDWDFKFNIPIHCGFFNKSLFDNFRFPEHLKAKEDWIMWLTFFQKKVSAVFINEILVYYRIHDRSMTKKSDHMLENTIKALDYLDHVIPEKDYKAYLLSHIENRMMICQKLNMKVDRISKEVINSNNSIGYKIEKKIKFFLDFFN